MKLLFDQISSKFIDLVNFSPDIVTYVDAVNLIKNQYKLLKLIHYYTIITLLISILPKLLGQVCRILS